MIKFLLGFLIILGLFTLGTHVTKAQLSGGMMFPGPGTVHSAGGGGGCTGAIDLSTGCVQPMVR